MEQVHPDEILWAGIVDSKNVRIVRTSIAGTEDPTCYVQEFYGSSLSGEWRNPCTLNEETSIYQVAFLDLLRKTKL